LQAPQRSSLKASAQEIDPTGKFPESSSLTGLQWYHKHQTLQYFFSLQIGTCIYHQMATMPDTSSTVCNHKQFPNNLHHHRYWEFLLI
jgi:hypothetical protein